VNRKAESDARKRKNAAKTRICESINSANKK
jgi:hypothetical protein